jgi:hypothetical protein
MVPVPFKFSDDPQQKFDTQSSRLAEFGGRGMSFKICRGTLGSLAMFTARLSPWPAGK